MPAVFSWCKSSRGSDIGSTWPLPPEAFVFAKVRQESHPRRTASGSNSDLPSLRIVIEAESSRFSSIATITPSPRLGARNPKVADGAGLALFYL